MTEQTGRPPRSHAPGGGGMPSWRQIPRAVGILISRWRGIVVRWPVAGVLPQLVLRGLASEAAAVISEVPLELALLHAAISTDSTSAQPVGGIASPRIRRSSRTSVIAVLDHLAGVVEGLALRLHLRQFRDMGVDPAVASVLVDTRRRRAETRGRGRRAADPRQQRGGRRQLESSTRRLPTAKEQRRLPATLATGSGLLRRSRVRDSAWAMHRPRAVGAAHESDPYDC